MSSYETPVRLPVELLEALASFTGNPETFPWVLEPFVCEAIRHYIDPATAAEQKRSAGSEAESPSEAGYQWKEAFLPEGTRLRASFNRQPYFATVEGAEIRYGEHAVSPSHFANLQGSGNRNAWKAIWLRFPGSEEWLLADVFRSARKAAIARLLGNGMPAENQLSRKQTRSQQEQETRPQREQETRPRQKETRMQPKQEPHPPANRTASRQPAMPEANIDGVQRKNASGRGRRRSGRAAKHHPGKQ